jgi:PAS domain S-box-containing protein
MSAKGNGHAELFRQLAITIPEALWVGDVEQKTIRYVNPAWEKVTGRHIAAGDALNKVLEAVHPDDLPAVLERGSQLTMGGVDLDCRLMRPDGIVRWVHMRTIPIDNSKGVTYRFIGIFDDITRRKEENSRVERLKDDFVATVSHELRTPLTSIAGALSLLVGNAAGALPESAVRLLTIAHNNSRRLIRLVNDILDIEKIESGKVLFVRKRVELRALVEQAIETHQGFANTYGVRVKFEPASAVEDVHSDPDRLFQVVINLLSNAIKFSPRGEEVVLRVEKRNSAARISVRDHGPGVPNDFKSHIFGKFAQADASDARQKGGTGLGLSIVKQIVTRLGGEVGFDDAPGGGAIFFVDLPTRKHGLETATESVAQPDVLQ